MALTYKEMLNFLKNVEINYPEALEKEFQLDVYKWDTDETSVYGIETIAINNREIKLEDTEY